MNLLGALSPENWLFACVRLPTRDLLTVMGVLSAVYGGAVHPSAEGHAAMADAALPAAAAVLQLDAAVPEVISQPVAPPANTR